MKIKYKSISILVGGSFYPYWSEYENKSSQDILTESIKESRSDLLNKVVEELDTVFSLIQRDANTGDIIGYQFGCSYNPEHDGKSDVEWMVEIKQKVSAELFKRENAAKK